MRLVWLSSLLGVLTMLGCSDSKEAETSGTHLVRGGSQCDEQCPDGWDCAELCWICGPEEPGAPECEPGCSQTCVPPQPQPDNCSEIGCPDGYACVTECSACEPGKDNCNGTCVEYCVPEGPVGCYGDFDCGPDEHCEFAAPPCDTGGSYPEVGVGTCVPNDNSSCAAVLCEPGTTCVEICVDCAIEEDGTVSDACEPGCYATCAPDQVNPCAAVLCGPGYTCEVVDPCELQKDGGVGCEPQAVCVPVDEGTYDGGGPIGPVDAGSPTEPFDGGGPIGPVDAGGPIEPFDGGGPIGPVDAGVAPY